MPTPNPWDYAERSGAEHAHQAAIFMWANMAVRFGYHVANHKEAYTVQGWALKNARGDLIPKLKWLHAIHNQGHGDAIRGAKAKAEGVKAGVFDMFLPVPMEQPRQLLSNPPIRVFWHGLYLELKVGKNQPSNDQLEFKRDMEAAGYATAIAWGWLDARKIILDYLQIPAYTAAIYST